MFRSAAFSSLQQSVYPPRPRIASAEQTDQIVLPAYPDRPHIASARLAEQTDQFILPTYPDRPHIASDTESDVFDAKEPLQLPSIAKPPSPHVNFLQQPHVKMYMPLPGEFQDEILRRPPTRAPVEAPKGILHKTPQPPSAYSPRDFDPRVFSHTQPESPLKYFTVDAHGKVTLGPNYEAVKFSTALAKLSTFLRSPAGKNLSLMSLERVTKHISNTVNEIPTAYKGMIRSILEARVIELFRSKTHLTTTNLRELTTFAQSVGAESMAHVTEVLMHENIRLDTINTLKQCVASLQGGEIDRALFEKPAIKKLLSTGLLNLTPTLEQLNGLIAFLE